MIIAYTALHYGSPYLEYAIRSVIDSVDRYFVLYAAQGSHGSRGELPLPPTESRQNLQWIAAQAAGDKLEWIDGGWTQEGQQRDAIHTICPDADAVLVLDYDEIWADGLAAQAIAMVRESNAQKYRIPMVHFWRSFRRAVLHDPAYPIKIIKQRGDVFGEDYLNTKSSIAHMGYAISTELLKYKLSIHGHKGELRQDDWLQNKWLANAQEDCHVVGSEYWNTEVVEPLDYLPHWMAQHPYYGLDVIE